MGIANFRRDRKKTISIVASLSLGGVILWLGQLYSSGSFAGADRKAVFPGWGL